MSDKYRLMIIAGEISGDMHAAKLVASIRDIRPDVEFFGAGGDNMRENGVELLRHSNELAAMGFSEVIRKFWFYRRVFHEMLAAVRERKPDAVILVDYPGFNLMFASAARGIGPKIIYYVCPQVWAWRRSRMKTMARCVDRLITIFPFEKDIFAGMGLRVDFAGHPLVEEANRTLSQSPADLDWKGKPKLALLPGSRADEINRILPAMLSAAALLEKTHPHIACTVASPSDTEAGLAGKVIESHPDKPANLSVVAGMTRQILRQADAALVASGTATIEAALLGCPMVVIYRTALVNYLLGKAVVRVPDIGMVNIVAGRRICPELVQFRASPSAISRAVGPLLEDTEARRSMLSDLDKVKAALGEGGSSARAAQMVMEEIGR